jgi:hypothetical protein
MHHNPKLPNLVRLAEFMDAGAPEWNFDMLTGAMKKFDRYSGKPVPTECGTAGCIAGAAFSMALGDMTPQERYKTLRAAANQSENEFAFKVVAQVACDWLGLTYEEDACAHNPLFMIAGHNARATPEQAAIAIRNTIAGEADPWAFME